MLQRASASIPFMVASAHQAEIRDMLISTPEICRVETQSVQPRPQTGFTGLIAWVNHPENADVWERVKAHFVQIGADPKNNLRCSLA